MTVYAIVKEPWKLEDGYPSRFKKDVFAKKSDAIVALREIAREAARRPEKKAYRFELEFEKDEAKIMWLPMASKCECSEVLYLRVEKLHVPNGRIVFSNGRAIVEDWETVLTKDPRFRFWDCREWIRQFFAAMGAYLHGGESQYTLEELKSNCDWWKFIGVPADQLDKPKLVVGCPWFVDHPECAHIHLESNDWVENLRDLSEGAWDRLIKIRPQLARYKNA